MARVGCFSKQILRAPDVDLPRGICSVPTESLMRSTLVQSAIHGQCPIANESIQYGSGIIKKMS